MASRVKIDEAGYREVFENTDGGVGRDLWKRAGKVEVAAKAQAGVETGNLKRSIGREWTRKRRGRMTVRVGSKVGHALVHHEGAEAHTISARPGSALRFVLNGRVVFARSVNHPGSPANRYLSDNLKLAGGVSRVR